MIGKYEFFYFIKYEFGYGNGTFLSKGLYKRVKKLNNLTIYFCLKLNKPQIK